MRECHFLLQVSEGGVGGQLGAGGVLKLESERKGGKEVRGRKGGGSGHAQELTIERVCVCQSLLSSALLCSFFLRVSGHADLSPVGTKNQP